MMKIILALKILGFLKLENFGNENLGLLSDFVLFD